MKNSTLLLVILFLISCLATGYSQNFPLANKKLNAPQLEPQPVSPDYFLTIPSNSSPQSVTYRDEQIIIGETYFDLQTNNSRMLYEHPNGNISAAWHSATDNDSAFPSRGTGYNHFDGTEWGDIPDERIEDTIRGGYPSFAVLGDGTDVAVSHKSTDGLWELGLYRKSPGSDQWIPSTIPSPSSEDFGGMVWGKVATGGPDGQTIHVIAITLSTDFGGSVYQGINEHLLYYRSLDGGETWDITEGIIPGCDSTNFNDLDAEAYQIDANGETVAVGVFSGWGDATIYKSLDNGDSWSSAVMLDFPLDKYDDSGYTTSDIPMDPNAPDTLAIFTTDGASSILVDDSDVVHVTFGHMYVLGENGDRFYFPRTDGISYWNDTKGEGEFTLAAQLEDFNGSDSIEITDIALYFFSLSSFPSMGIDDDGVIYLAYSALHEEYVHVTDEQNFRHVFLTASEDGGETWTSPFAAINGETVDPYAIEFLEGVYPNIPKRIGNTIPLTYMQDLRPGMHVLGDEDPIEKNEIVYVNFEKSELGIVGSTQKTIAIESFDVFPNPAHQKLTVEFNLKDNHLIQLKVIDLFGRTLTTKSLNAVAGVNQETLDVSKIPAGVYSVQLELEGKVTVKKVVVGK